MISVIIPTHKPRLDFLKQTLESLEKQTFKNFEVVIVENPESTEEVRELTLPFSFSMFLTSSEAGANKARNKGAYLAKGDVLVFIDDDIVLSPDLLSIYDAAHKVYDAGAIGGPVNLRYVDGKPLWINEHFEGYLARLDHKHPYGMMPFEVYQEWELHVPLVSANLSFKKSTFNTFYGFDEAQGYVGKSLLAPNDELGLLTKCTKFKTPGLVYVPKAYVSHLIPKERANSEYLSRRMYGQGVADFNSLKILHPKLTSLEIYDRFLNMYNSLLINDLSSFYTLFKGMSRVDRLHATMVYHKGRCEYSRGILSQVTL